MFGDTLLMYLDRHVRYPGYLSSRWRRVGSPQSGAGDRLWAPLRSTCLEPVHLPLGELFPDDVRCEGCVCGYFVLEYLLGARGS